MAPRKPYEPKHPRLVRAIGQPLFFAVIVLMMLAKDTPEFLRGYTVGQIVSAVILVTLPLTVTYEVWDWRRQKKRHGSGQPPLDAP